MTKATQRVICLTREGCGARQRRLSRALESAGLKAAIIFDRRQVHAYCGYWQRSAYQPALLVLADGSTYLAAPTEPEPVAFVKEVHLFQAAKIGTLIDDQIKPAIETLRPHLYGMRDVGADAGVTPEALFETTVRDVRPILRNLQRRKLADEVQMIAAGLRACEGCYALAREIIQPGLDEISMYAQILAAATQSVGEPIGEFGNDFQSGTPGGPPRHREMHAGELLPLDLSVIVRGYGSDLCRTFCVGGKPTEAQRDAHRMVEEALRLVEDLAGPGASCRQLFSAVFKKLDGYRGWRFPHHLGHGIGLSTHESPRLNPNWDDLLEEGDVFTVEPGLYGEELNGGVRLEENYLVTADGITRLSFFPLDL